MQFCLGFKIQHKRYHYLHNILNCLFLQITFKVPNAPGGRKSIRFDLSKLCLDKTSFGKELSPLVVSAEEFCDCINAKLDNEKAPESPERPFTSPPSPNEPRKRQVKPAKKRKVFATGKPPADSVDLPSPSKSTKIKAMDVDQKIDAHYIGRFERFNSFIKKLIDKYNCRQ